MLKRTYQSQDVILAGEAEPYAQLYARMAEHLPGLKGVWWSLANGTLNILTLIQADRELEGNLHDVELAFFDEVGDPPIRFRIYNDEESIRVH